ncbi:MAG: hypothetical protein IPN43_17300 [Chitinophagaceae bacterium]|nr:hypothetical protein [Chitinophagaceae bacterium]
MEIKYKNTLDKELIKASKIQWRYANQKSIKTILICIFFSLGFFAWGLLTMNSSGFWNFKTSVGVAYAMLTLIISINLSHKRVQRLSSCTKAIETKNKKCIEYTFNNEKIMIKETDAYAESSWDIITGYRQHNNFLFLYINSSKSSYFTVDQNDMAEVNFTTLLSFVKTKIPLEK